MGYARALVETIIKMCCRSNVSGDIKDLLMNRVLAINGCYDTII
jgi:hypothetical protein